MSKYKLRHIIKTDAESSIGRGCILHGGHFRPEIMAMPRAVDAATAKLFPQFTTIRWTEGWRPARKDERGRRRRDLHAELRALDFTIETDEEIGRAHV